MTDLPVVRFTTRHASDTTEPLGSGYIAPVQHDPGFERCVYIVVERGTIDVPAAIRLRDGLTAYIDAAGPRPLHPLIGDAIDDLAPGETRTKRISDRLYELDERRAREARS